MEINRPDLSNNINEDIVKDPMVNDGDSPEHKKNIQSQKSNDSLSLSFDVPDENEEIINIKLIEKIYSALIFG